MKNLELLVKELCKLPRETTWVEFKRNNFRPNSIGERISALANAAALEDRNNAYMVWGVDDETHELVGTSAYLIKSKIDFDGKGEFLLNSLNMK